MNFGAPERLLLLAVIAFASWQWRNFGLRRPLRILCLVLAVFILAEPRIQRGGTGTDLWALVDRSASAGAIIEPRLEEVESLLQSSKGKDDRLYFVDFAASPLARGESEGEIFSGSRDETNIASALRFCLARIPPDRSARLLILTDGFSTSPLVGMGELLASQRIPLDYRLFTSEAENDYRVAQVMLPQRVRVNESFIVETQIIGFPDSAVSFSVRKDGVELAQGKTEVENSVASLRFADRLDRSGSYNYEVEIYPENDAIPGNNRASAWTEAVGGSRILLLTSSADDPIARALEGGGFEVETLTVSGAFDVGRLSGAAVVVINNVSASLIPGEFLDALDFYVEGQGGGLIMVGGKNSFGSGGYYKSSIDGLLPVSMELKDKDRKHAFALAIVLDRSGSMAEGAGKSGLTKMALADEGAARAVEFLSVGDDAAVLAVDTVVHRVVPLTGVQAGREEIARLIRSIGSMGAGIYIYAGLEAAWKELKKSTAAVKHVILFADAADCERPDDYKSLVAEMVRDQITVSSIGLGRESDVHAPLLKEIAFLGNGRAFFSDDPADLPALFSQETAAAARSAFASEPVNALSTPLWQEVSTRPMAWLRGVDGYNLTQLKPSASQALYADDKHSSPLFAFQQKGVGRTAAICFPLGGENSGQARAWGNYAEFVQTVARWASAEEAPPGIALRTRLSGTRLDLDLFYDETWRDRLLNPPPLILMENSAPGAVEELVWQKMRFGNFQASVDLKPNVLYRGAVGLPGAALSFGPVAVGAGPEWSFDAARAAELKSVSRLSGGEERLDLSLAFGEPTGRGELDPTPWLLLALLGAFLAEAFVSVRGRDYA